MALHDNLKDVRNRVGMSQEFVADQLGISRQAVTKWELGQSKPNAKNLQALAELYHVSSEELLSNTQQKGPNLILRTNLTKWAIIFQSAFLYSCTQEIFQLRHPTSPSEQKRDCEKEDKYAILYQNGIGGRKYATLHRYPDRR